MTANLLVLTWLIQLAEVHGVKIGSGIASLYRPWKKSRFVPYARYPGNWAVKPTPDDLVCAHRTLPFWTLLRLRRSTGQVAYCVVLDRGPYGFCDRDLDGDDPRCKRGGKWVVSTSNRGRRGYYRGTLDATPAVHEMLGSRGWARVHIEVVRNGPVPSKHVLRRNTSGAR